MTRENPNDKNKPMTDAPGEEHEAPQRDAAPPIEREHETHAGVIEEDERREQEKQGGGEEDEQRERR